MRKSQENAALAQSALEYLTANGLLVDGIVQFEQTNQDACKIATSLHAMWSMENDAQSLSQSLNTLLDQQMYIEVYVLLQQIHKQLSMEIPPVLELAIHHQEFMKILLYEIVTTMSSIAV